LPKVNGGIWCDELESTLRVEGHVLRLYDSENNLRPTMEEASENKNAVLGAELEIERAGRRQERAELRQERAERERERAEKIRVRQEAEAREAVLLAENARIQQEAQAREAALQAQMQERERQFQAELEKMRVQLKKQQAGEAD
jgi:hypothetical protein